MAKFVKYSLRNPPRTMTRGEYKLMSRWLRLCENYVSERLLQRRLGKHLVYTLTNLQTTVIPVPPHIGPTRSLEEYRQSLSKYFMRCDMPITATEIKIRRGDIKDDTNANSGSTQVPG